MPGPRQHEVDAIFFPEGQSLNFAGGGFSLRTFLRHGHVDFHADE